MNYTNQVWQLTDQEIEEVTLRGGSITEAQEAKKQAYLDSGGIILNPDALSELYEALKVALWNEEHDEYQAQHQGKPRLIERIDIYKQALSKAEGN